MLGALGGHTIYSTPWARYTSDAKLLVWKLADPAFATWANDSIGTAYQKCHSYDRWLLVASAFRSRTWTPGAPPADDGPTHFSNMAKGNAFALGTCDATREHITLTSCKTVAEGVEYAWTATGAAIPAAAVAAGCSTLPGSGRRPTSSRRRPSASKSLNFVLNPLHASAEGVVVMSWRR